MEWTVFSKNGTGIIDIHIGNNNSKTMTLYLSLKKKKLKMGHKLKYKVQN